MWYLRGTRAAKSNTIVWICARIISYFGCFEMLIQLRFFFCFFFWCFTSQSFRRTVFNCSFYVYYGHMNCVCSWVYHTWNEKSAAKIWFFLNFARSCHWTSKQYSQLIETVALKKHIFLAHFFFLRSFFALFFLLHIRGFYFILRCFVFASCVWFNIRIVCLMPVNLKLCCEFSTKNYTNTMRSQTILPSFKQYVLIRRAHIIVDRHKCI